jgi:hypothetical protein
MREEACARGADAVVAVKADGLYREGTALRWTAPPAAPVPAAATSTPTHAAPAPTRSEGRAWVRR